MMKKLPLTLAALFLALGIHAAPARAMDDECFDPEAAMEMPDEELDGDLFAHPGHWRRGMRGQRHPMSGKHMKKGNRGPGFAGRHDSRHDGLRGGGHGGMRMFRDLDLTDAQKERVIDAMTNSFRERLTLRMEQDSLFRQLRDQHDADTPDSDKIVELNRELGELRGKLNVIGLDYHEALQQILTQEQKDTIQERVDAMEKRFQERRERGPRYPRGPGFER